MWGTAALGLALVAAVAWAGPYAVGETVRRFTALDQHGRQADVDERVRIVVVSRDMDAGSVVKQALADADQRWLDERRAVYVADVSGMPALVSRIIALPRMRRRAYRVLLDREGSLARDFPHLAGQATVVFLDALRVTRVAHAASPEELRALLTP
jgi:hypothetical protein